MIKAETIYRKKEFISFLRIILLLVLILYITFRVLDSRGFFIEVIHCGAEQVVKKDSVDVLISDKGYRFDNANGRTNEKAFEGIYSIKLIPQNQYGMAITFDKPKDNEEMEASVWRFIDKTSADTSGYAFIVAAVGNTFWKGSYKPEEIKNGWGKLSIKFSIPKGDYHDPIVIYCWNSTKNAVYYDNMTIKRNNYRKYFRN